MAAETFEKFRVQLNEQAKRVNGILAELVEKQAGIESELKKAIVYTLEGPGKRIRSALVLWCCQVVGGKINRDAEMAAAAVEMVHTYSLIHDDLPAIDNDDMRRGRATCHKQFGEATAILVGDGLLTLGFGVLAKEIGDSKVAVSLIEELAGAAGICGMIAGQMADLNAEKTEPNESVLEYIHTNKTAKMFRCAAAMGGICGRASEQQYSKLCEYGLKVGLAFQVADDILDISGSSEEIGKTAGKDVKAGKVTYPALLGVEKSKELEKRLAKEAVGVLERFGEEADILRLVPRALLERTK